MVQRSPIVSQSEFLYYADRLRRSNNKTERDSILLGFNPVEEYPVLLHKKLLNQHALITGTTGSGKTSLGLIPMITQLIRGNDGTVIVLDLKGDDAMFNTARIEARRAGRQFKWFTNRTGYSTYVFNPFAEAGLHSLTIREVTGFFVSMLNLFHGSDYGRAYFSIMARSLLMACFESTSNAQGDGSLHSFGDLHHRMSTLLQRSGDDYRAAEHLAFVIMNLAGFPQLNLAGSKKHDAANANAIRINEAVDRKQVLYFYLSACNDIYSLSEMARMVLFATLQAAEQYKRKHRKSPQVYVICDEAQLMVAQNISNVMAQARSFGVGCVLALQSLSQLCPPGGPDLRQLVLNCTTTKQFWATNDPLDRDFISKISGEVTYYNAGWNQAAGDVRRGYVSRDYSVRAGENSYETISVSEEVGPRLTAQDIDNYSRDPNTSITAIQRNSGYSCYDGAFPVFTPYIMDEEEYDRRSDIGLWPDQTRNTIVIEPEWNSKRMTPDRIAKTQEVEEAAGLEQLKQLEGLGGF